MTLWQVKVEMNTRALILDKTRSPTFQISAIAFVGLAILVAAQLLRFQYAHAIEGTLIVTMGAWRFFHETSRYQRFRIAFIVLGVSLVWFVIPLFQVQIPRIGSGGTVDFPSIHVIGAVTFFAFLVPVVLFGRGADCGWFCPCVALRETVGHPFRRSTPRGRIWWRLRHLKWPMMIVGLGMIPVALIAGDHLGAFERPFNLFLFYGYWGSFILLPVLGNRNFCRWGCPFGAIWGVVGKYGFFRIESKTSACTSCGTCETVCDMGIPLARFASSQSMIRNAECMGCGRCQESCPKGALQLKDIRGPRKIPNRFTSK